MFAPFLQQTLQPFLITTLGEVPGIGNLFAGPPYGIGILTAGLILAIMVLPFITSISRDVFEAVPPVLKEAAYGSAAPPGKSRAMSCCPMPASASSAASCWRLGARSAKPWRSPS